MSGLPRFMRRHRLTAEPHLAEGAYGATYGPPVELAVWVDGKQGTARANDGSTVTTTGTVLAHLDDAASLVVGTRVTFRGDVAYVLAVDTHDGGGLVPLEHLEASIG